MIPFDITKLFGHPWHGLVSSGQLTLPNGQTAEHVQPSSGDCWVIKIPGQPAVERSPEEAAADAAAGRQWLNYALLSGENHVLYGKAIGAGAWIYIDADKRRWLVTCAQLDGTATVASATVAGALTFSLTLRNFGELEVAPRVYTLVASTTSPGLPGAWQSSTLPIRIEDISSTGAKVAIGLGRTGLALRGRKPEDGGRHVDAFLLLTITGVEGSLAASISVLHDYDATWGLPGSHSVTEDFVTVKEYTGALIDLDHTDYHPDGSRTETWLPRSRFDALGSNVQERSATHVVHDFTQVMGVVFNAADVPVPVTFRCHYQMDSTGAQSNETFSGSVIDVYDASNNLISHTDTVQFDWSGGGSDERQWQIWFDGPWGSMSYMFSQDYQFSWTEILWGPGSNSANTSWHQVHPLYGTVDYSAAGAPDSGSHYTSPLPGEAGFVGAEADLRTSYDVPRAKELSLARLTAKAWLIWSRARGMTELPTTPPDEARYWALVTPAGSTALTGSAPVPTDYHPPRDKASWQPVSGALIGPVETPLSCWV